MPLTTVHEDRRGSTAVVAAVQEILLKLVVSSRHSPRYNGKSSARQDRRKSANELHKIADQE